jgi:hypothetical protein
MVGAVLALVVTACGSPSETLPATSSGDSVAVPSNGSPEATPTPGGSAPAQDSTDPGGSVAGDGGAATDLAADPVDPPAAPPSTGSTGETGETGSAGSGSQPDPGPEPAGTVWPDDGCSADNSPTPATSAEGPAPVLEIRAASTDGPLPDLAVRRINCNGGWVNLRNEIPSALPLLVWFWAPH